MLRRSGRLSHALMRNWPVQALVSQQRRLFAAPPDDGSDRNDYQSQHFEPFNYNTHGRSWDATRWPLVTAGKEQSPIHLYRRQPTDFELDGKVEEITFDDRVYKHRYRTSYEQTEGKRE